MSSGQKLLSRRHLLSLATGAAGVLVAGKALAQARGTSTGTSPVGGASKMPAVAPSIPASTVASPAQPAAPALVTNPAPAQRGPVMRPLVVPGASAAVASLFGNVGQGTRLGDAKVVAVHDVYMGAIPVVLEAADGTRFQLDVVRRSADVAGVGNGRELSVFVSNKGSGRSPTHEKHGLAALALASALDRQAGAPLPKALLTLRQRNARFPRGGFAIPV